MSCSFINIIYLELPEYFEDNMGVWFTHFLFLIQVDIKALASDSDDEPGTLELLKAQVSHGLLDASLQDSSSVCMSFTPKNICSCHGSFVRLSFSPYILQIHAETQDASLPDRHYAISS